MARWGPAFLAVMAILPAANAVKPSSPTAFYWSAGEDFLVAERAERFLNLFPPYFNGYNSMWGENFIGMAERIQTLKRVRPAVTVGYYTTWGFHVRGCSDVWTRLIDGTEGDTITDLAARTHVPSMASSAFLESFEPLAKKLQKTGFQRFLVADSNYPIGPSYQPGGYAQSDIASFRTILEEKDPGIVFNNGVTPITKHFWDYFESYFGFRLVPKDVGLTHWREFTPPANLTPDLAGGTHNKAILLWYNLIRYEFLRFNAHVGGVLNAHGITLENVSICELPIHGIDELWLTLCRGNDTLLIERFDDAYMVYFHDVTSDDRIQRFRWYGRQKAVGRPGYQIGIMGELGHGGNSKPYWSPGYTFVTWYDLAAAQVFSEAHHDWLEQGRLEGKSGKRYTLTEPEEMTSPSIPVEYFRYLQLLMSGEGVQCARQDRLEPASKSKVLYLGERPLIRRTWHLQSFSNDVGYLSQILLAWGIPFDFADYSLVGVNLEDYETIVYNCIDLPDGMMTRLGAWLKGHPERRLIAHGSLPTHRISHPKWVAGFFSGEDSSPALNRVIDPGAAAAVGLTKITLGGRIDAAAAAGKLGGPWDLRDVQERLWIVTTDQRLYPDQTPKGKGIFGQEWFHLETDRPSRVLLAAGSLPLVTEIGSDNDGKVVYIHYDCGRMKNFSLDSKILLSLLDHSGIKPLVDGQNGVSVHTYTPADKPGTVFVIRNRDLLLQKLKAGNATYYGGYYPGLMTPVRLFLPPGTYGVYQFLNDTASEVKADAKGLQFEIPGQAGEIVVVVPANQARAVIETWRQRRREYEKYLGPKNESAFADLRTKPVVLKRN